MIEASVIIPTRNRPDDLRRCLEALSRQRTARRFEVVVVDDSAGPSPLPRVDGGLEVAAISSGGRGPGAARNAGIAAARGALVLFTDDDTSPSPGWVEAACSFLASHPECVGVEGKTVSPAYDHLYEHSVENDAPGTFLACNIAFRKEVLDELGGFDARSFPAAHCEDLDLAFRAQRLGPIGFEPRMEILHHPRPISLRRLVARSWLASSEVRLFKRHRDRWPARTPVRLLPVFVVSGKWARLLRAEGWKLLVQPRRAARFSAAAVGQIVVTAVAVAVARS